MKRILRILTLLAYCLPFAFFVETCVGSDTKVAFNTEEMTHHRQEAITYEQQKRWRDSITAIEHNDSLRPQFNQAAPADSANIDTTQAVIHTSVISDSEKPSTLNKSLWWFYAAWQHIKSPTEQSLSGIGTIFAYKNIAGKLLIAGSFILSLILLLNLRIFNTKKRKITLFALNIGLLISFLVLSLLSSVSLLWGFWITLILLFVQLYQETMERPSDEQKIDA